MNKNDLINKVKALEGISQDERAYLIDLINTKKKYGLVWEDKLEDVEETLRTQLPVLQEVKEKRIIGKRSEQDLGIGQDRQNFKKSNLITLFDNVLEHDSENNQSKNHVGRANLENPVRDYFPNHTLIEGDNLHALTALTFTHENKIDVIYIDPPYNTGNKDFKYNDSFVDKEDSYRHSKWLSFMDKRLRIAKRLLSDKGVIFISIDDNENAQLKMLCDEVFGEANFVADIIWQKVYSPRMDAKGFSSETENIICFSKNSLYLPNKVKIKQESKQFNILDKKTEKFYRRRSWRKEGSGSNRSDRPNLFYPILSPDNIDIYPMKPDKSEGRWRGNLSYFQELIDNDLIEYIKDKNNDWQIYVKQFLEEDAQRPPTNLWLNEDVGHTHEASEEIKTVFGSSVFLTPKPMRLIRRILEIGGQKDSTILDFFAGSGTTLHATMALNAEDGGRRQCILVTNNENNICEEVTYERNRRVIEGYYKGNLTPSPSPDGEGSKKGSGAVWVAGLSGNNLRYYKTATVEREPSIRNKRQLTRLATELLCIKEDCYKLSEQDLRIGQDEQDFINEMNHSNNLVGHGNHKNPVKTNEQDFDNQLNNPVGHGNHKNPVKTNEQDFDNQLNNPVSHGNHKNPVRDNNLVKTMVLFEENGKRLLMVYDDTAIDDAVALLKQLIAQDDSLLTKVYVFSNGQYPYTEDFEDVLPHITLCALPDAIYKAYQHVLPKRERKNVVVLEEENSLEQD